MAVRSAKNLYPGVNPHLNSFLQTDDGGWESFHAELIVQIRQYLDSHLPEGYLALAEKSLQVREITPPITTTTRTRPDITVYQSPVVGSSAVAIPATAPTDVLALMPTLEEEEFLTGVMIYQTGEGSPYGKPITRIEVLSAANKPNHPYHARYHVKRMETLHSAIRLVELDFLHETPPILATLATYSDKKGESFPYYIIVTDPRPTFEQGQIFFYGIEILDPIPAVNVPLAGVDRVVVDFGEIYHRVYESLRMVQVIVDYETEPVNFHKYSLANQQQIRATMADILTS